MRTRSGRVFTGVHLEANVGRIAACAEAVAPGRAATEAGDTDVDTVVAVYHPARPPQTRRCASSPRAGCAAS
jgi:cytidine deaminase